MIDKLAKRIVTFFSIILLTICVITSLVYITTVKNFSENVIINLTTGIGLITYLAIDLFLIFVIKKIEDKVKISKKIKILIIALLIIVYGIISAYWVNMSNVPPVDDSKSVNDLAVSFVNRRRRSYKK